MKTPPRIITRWRPNPKIASRIPHPIGGLAMLLILALGVCIGFALHFLFQ